MINQRHRKLDKRESWRPTLSALVSLHLHIRNGTAVAVGQLLGVAGVLSSITNKRQERKTRQLNNSVVTSFFSCSVDTCLWLDKAAKNKELLRILLLIISMNFIFI